MQYHGGVQYLGDIMTNVRDILNNVEVFSTEGYHEYYGGYHDAPGDIMMHWGYHKY